MQPASRRFTDVSFCAYLPNAAFSISSREPRGATTQQGSRKVRAIHIHHCFPGEAFSSPAVSNTLLADLFRSVPAALYRYTRNEPLSFNDESGETLRNRQIRAAFSLTSTRAPSAWVRKQTACCTRNLHSRRPTTKDFQKGSTRSNWRYLVTSDCRDHRGRRGLLLARRRAHRALHRRRARRHNHRDHRRCALPEDALR